MHRMVDCTLIVDEYHEITAVQMELVEVEAGRGRGQED